MANANHATTPVSGVNVDARSTDNVTGMAPGTTVMGNDNTQWLYGKASAAVNAATVVIVTRAAKEDYTFAAGAGTHTSGAAFAINEYGWVKLTAGANPLT